jgi:hypothetical protein
MPIELRKRVVNVLACMHRRETCGRRSGGGGSRSGRGGALDHVDGVSGLDLVGRDEIIVLMLPGQESDEGRGI